MAWFMRKQSGQKEASSRTLTQSQMQAAEMRVRARRRLIGALVLVLAAVIVVPQIFDDSDNTESGETPIVLPAPIPSVSEPDLAVNLSPPDTSEPELLPPQGERPAQQEQENAESAADSESDSSSYAASDTASRPEQSSKPKPPSRTDDGSVALALLEGRTPTEIPTTASANLPQKGNFILQIAAYSTEADAKTRQQRLVDAGVTNAYVEKTTANDKTAYRLRVGSFPTRDAAVAAQARLRALGYDNSLLLSQ